MQGRRILIFLVVFLVTLPVVTAAADSVAKAADDGLVIRLGDLHEGERFVYDLHLTSKYRDLDIQIPGFYDITIERVRDFQTLDGATHDVVATHVDQKVQTWERTHGTVTHGSENVTQYVRIEDGVYVARMQEDVGTSWLERDGAVEEHHRQRVARIEGNGNGGDLYGRGIHPGSTYIHGNFVQKMALTMLTDADRPVDDVGQWQGDKVYAVDGGAWERSDSRASFRCSSEHPEFDYYDQDAPIEFEGRTFTEHLEQRAWVRPGIAFPVLNTCHSTYHERGRLVEQITLTLELSHHEAGDEPIPVNWDRRNERTNYEPIGTLEPLPSAYAGVPVGGESLGVSLKDAVDVVRTSDDPALRTWRDDGTRPFWVSTATYMPHIQRVAVYDADSPSGPVPLPVPVPSDPTNPTQPEEPDRVEEQRVGVSWYLHLANQAGEGRDVRVTFEEPSPGSFGPGTIEEVQESYAEAPWVDGRMSAEFVSLDDLVARFLSDSGVSPDAWTQGSLDHLRIDNRIVDDGDRGYRTWFTASFSAIDPSAAEGDQRAPRLLYDYDTRNGAPLGAGTGASWTSETASTPEQPSYQPASVSVPVRTIDFPTAATASGFALALGFVVAFFWDGVARTFGQFVGAPLYAKIRKDKVLDHRTRDLIATTVAENPGIAVEELRREVAVGYGTVCHHLDTLQRNGLVTSRKVGRRRCYFVPGAVDADEMASVGVAGTRAATRLIEIVAAEPGLTQSELAARLGVADSSVRYQAKRLLAHERLRAEREGRSVRYYPIDAAAA